MQQIKLKERHAVMLELLSYIHTICERYKLRYSLGGGTLLGAVKYRGFVPWDDDADVFLPRPDYELLMKLFNQQNHYRVLTPTMNDYYYTYAKLVDPQTSLQTRYRFDQDNDLGIFVDIFPVDGLPDQQQDHQSFLAHNQKLRQQFLCSTPFYYSGTKWYTTIAKMVKFLPTHLKSQKLTPSEWKFKLLRSLQQYEFNHAKWAGFSLDGDGAAEVLPREAYELTILKSFEGRQLRVITQYDVLLRQLFGNYWQDCPKRQQNPAHQYKAYWK